MSGPGEVTSLLQLCRDGDRGARDRLVEIVYGELRAIARTQRRRARAGDTFSTTAVVAEAYLKLSASERAAWNDRAHFYAVAARAMRQILIDYARRRHRARRGGDAVHVPLDESTLAVERESDRILILDEALRRLEAEEPRAVRVVECRYFGGLSEGETARALGISPRTVQREWQEARRRLAAELGGRP